jgi:uncharacterized protein (DUF58 family)
MHPRLATLLLIALTLISLVLANPALYLLDALIVLMVGASALWGKYCLAGVTYTRRLGAQRLFFGEETDLWVEVVNAKPLPLAWLSASDDFPVEAKVTSLELNRSSDPRRRTLSTVLSLRWYERVRRHYRLAFTHRGRFEFGPVTLASGDLFGFRTRYLDLAHPQTLMVYPKVVPLETLDVPAARPLGDFRLHRRIVADPLRLAGVRDYRPGDSIRHIHWKASAHRGALQTKTFDPSAAHQLLVLLNVQTLEHIYEGVVSDYLETAIVTAASVAQAGLNARYPVGLYTNGAAREAPHRVRLAPSRHSSQGMQILETLAQLTSFTFLSFEEMLRAEAPALPYGATLIAVSAIFTAGIRATLLSLRAQGHPVALIIVGDLAHRLPPDDVLPIYRVTQNWTELETLKFATEPSKPPVHTDARR